MNDSKRDTCDLCKTKKPDLTKEDGWEMQHLHFAEETVRFLTCDKCKLESPMKFMKAVVKERSLQ